MIRIASAPTSRTKTPGSGRFLEYLAYHQGM
ncbi:rCG57757 [Rattus norvegicus]|uniref:RCG57757 n=1 Tax=Rattus norvegicus TaxID=10116 RepID=A6JHC8_RAT|nr:rCG57757 [Rattus norvegicus]